MKNKKTLIGFIIVALLALIMTFVYFNNKPTTSQGSKTVTVEVVDSKGETTSYEVSTDAEYLADLMDELQTSTDFSYVGSESEYGLYIEAVNGETADYTTDSAYWAIYVGDDYGQYGADQQPVTDGETYRFVWETY